MPGTGPDLTGRVALVTGAGRGLGWGAAVALARAGARVVATDIDEEDLARAVRDVEAEGGEALGRELDVADGPAFHRVVAEAVGRWGRLDALVHCAIHMPLESFEGLEPASWRRQLDVGLGGLYHGARAAWGPMTAGGGGHLVGIASGSSLRGYKEEIAYCTVKHGQEGFVKALALEARDVNIAVNTMGPGRPVKPTRMTWAELEALPADAKAGWADPRELGRALAWLVAQPPARLTGLRLDAGPIVDALDAHGPDFDPTPERITLYPDDVRARRAWMAAYEA